MRRLLLPAAGVLALGIAGAVLAGPLSPWPWVPGALLVLLGLSLLAATVPTLCLFGPAWIRGPAGDRVALTLDDGPDPEGTPAILDALERAGMRATFFAVGERAAAHPELLRRIAAGGHQVGNHSMHHRWPAIFSRAGARRELMDAQRTLGELLGAPPTLYRPPIGLLSPFVFQAVEEAGLTLSLWSLRTLDGRDPDPRSLLRRLARVRGGDVVLLHDGRGPHGRVPAREAIDDVIALLRRRGLRSVTLDELFEGQPRPGPSRAAWVGHVVRLGIAALILAGALG